MKYMKPPEFMELGFLQEVNRQFLHPLGLALAVTKCNDSGVWTFGPVLDARDDLEGFVFTKDSMESDDATDKAVRVSDELEKHRAARIKLFGDAIQPICGLLE